LTKASKNGIIIISLARSSRAAKNLGGNNMKKFLAVVLAATMIFTLVACGSEKKTDAKASKGKVTSLTIANTPKCIGISWWDRMQVGNERFAKETGSKVYQAGPVGGADVAVSIQCIEDAIASGVDVINVIPIDPDAVGKALENARKAGIIVISHEAQGMSNVDWDIEAFNNYEYGAHIMDILAAEMGEEGGYCIKVGNLTNVSHNQWADGAIKRQQEAYPKMFQVCERVEGSGQEGAYNAAKEVIAKYPEVKGFMGCDTNDPPGIAQAIEEAGKSGTIHVTGTCLASQAKQYMENGTIKTFVYWDPADAGEAMCKLALMVKNGEEIKDGLNLNMKGFEKCKVEGNVVIGSAWVDVTKDNFEANLF